MNTLDKREYSECPRALEKILAKTSELGFAMASEPRTGILLKTLAASKPSGRFLELGTGTGVATAWLLDGMDAGSTLISVDTDPVAQHIAQEFLGNDARLKLILKDGLEFLEQAELESFDLVFADAMPGKFEGLEECLRVVKRGGFYIIDDLLPQANWPEGHAEKIPVLINKLARNKAFTIASLEWASGIVIASQNSARGAGAPILID